jgi:hypothetical protein
MHDHDTKFIQELSDKLKQKDLLISLELRYFIVFRRSNEISAALTGFSKTDDDSSRLSS